MKTPIVEMTQSKAIEIAKVTKDAIRNYIRPDGVYNIAKDVRADKAASITGYVAPVDLYPHFPITGTKPYGAGKVFFRFG